LVDLAVGGVDLALENILFVYKFQSLFYWKPLLDLVIDNNGKALAQFQSLFYWKPLLDKQL
jgi:hypothetical protein